MTGGVRAVPSDDDVEIALEAAQVDGGAGVGRVTRAGARGGALVDRRVLVGPGDPCGECDVCRCGGATVCPSARRRALHGDTAIAAARWLVPLGDGLELAAPAAAAVAGDVATAYTLYARTGVAPREPVVVVGGTPIGRFLIEILLAKGVQPVALVPGADGAAGADDDWAGWLRGKRVVVAADREALVAALGASDHTARPWRMFCADPAALAIAAALAGPRATLTVLAAPALPSLPGAALAREITVIGVAGPHPDLVVEAAALCVKREIDLEAGTSLSAERLRTHVRSFT